MTCGFLQVRLHALGVAVGESLVRLQSRAEDSSLLNFATANLCSAVVYSPKSVSGVKHRPQQNYQWRQYFDPAALPFGQVRIGCDFTVNTPSADRPSPPGQ